ncbi:heterokaryon incompatibility protein HET-6-like protein [Colletotrichum sojae]|uniref:Heterokaryon incompatibility protein HET-6-like protein n=1 Tax=Colletotrichum sojae TaxID=2175907 RepID=A0A8H6J1W7_9PEZI|nr:heterokaryon incompatibility protein HET-6-like protein [Colletotrichum sojae]
MSRWHDKSCLRPQIEVENGTPKCLACHQRPHLSELAAAGAATNSSPPIPPDKPLGELNLWWPPCVPYEAPNTRVEDTTRSTHDARTLPSPPVAKTEVQMPPIGSSSVVYEKAIRSDQLRLIYLQGVEDYDYPVHVALEVHDLENCPEYEAVSYTWGGENGDSTRYCPVYIGPFWDVLFQTKNCWEMLRFMRPRRDARIFWVDAICIDQSNVPERNSQVANMGWIYSQCSRVVLYLGPDMAVPLGGRHPRRHQLHELETGSVVPKFPETHKPPHLITLRTILGRQYFTRAWIIQELVLPSRLSIGVGDVDFWADGNTTNYLSSGVTDWAWEQTEAPWGRLLTQGPLVSNELLDLLACPRNHKLQISETVCLRSSESCQGRVRAHTREA